MALHAKVDEARGPAVLDINPLYCRIEHPVPKHRLPMHSMDPDAALQVVRDELILDGNARLNLATFVTTWMEPQAEQLMADCFSKNMIDKDEYPQTAELERRCVNILAHLWHAPAASPAAAAGDARNDDGDAPDRRPAVRRRGPARPAMLGGLALLWRWRADVTRQSGRPGQRTERASGTDREAEPGDGCQRPGVLGEVLPVLAGRAEARADGARPPPPDRAGSRGALRRQHDRRRRRARLHHGRQL